MERISTGVEGLDRMLHGGLLPKRPYVVSGPSGSGKTTLAMHFLLEGIRRAEPVLLVALDEPPSEVKANTAAFGWNLDRCKILDATPDVKAHKRTRSVIDVGTTLDVRDMEDVSDIRRSSQIRALEVTIHGVQKMMKQEFYQRLEATGERYLRIVVDSMTALKMFSLDGEDARILIQSFMRFLSELEATTLLVSERRDPTSLETEFLLARGEVRLHKWLDGDRVKRAVSVERLRGSAFDDRYRPMVIGDRGMVVYPTGEVPSRGLSAGTVGAAFLEGRVADELANLFEDALQAVDAAHRRRLGVKDAESALLRAMLAFHRRRYETAFRHVLEARTILDARLGGKGKETSP
jgi:KaiC/GvpD/RAD55 family RecA-like ATPase